MALFEAEADESRFIDNDVSVPDWFDSGLYSDLTITCNGQELKVHRGVLASRWQFFERCCDGGFLEQHSRNIKMDDHDPSVLKSMLGYLYTSDLRHVPSPDKSEPGSGDLYQGHLLDLLILADMYELPHLSISIIDAIRSIESSSISMGSRIKSFFRIATLPTTVYGQGPIMHWFRHEITSLDLPWSSLWELQHTSTDPILTNGEPHEQALTTRMEAAKTNEDIMKLMAEHPTAALDLIVHLGESLTRAKQAIPRDSDESEPGSESSNGTGFYGSSGTSEWQNSSGGEASDDEMEDGDGVEVGGELEDDIAVEGSADAPDDARG
ncbi:uncharacterized protein AB675_7295 [Cyphellophora attinorum]|uniref:BTB domain-containing protein n=1 Tax=Cyphellophora attinorum TaxID=1664694 RepID=A0A0N1NYU0_9EURO|nr:uncharacterized protein AB675_7295 [Phialophora attinorum]KPI36273.1 hypothetical protein AB675_7295 [Phialophora attinorum]